MNDLPYAKKGLGQHWLTDFAALQSMVVAAEVAPGDVVLEIGPGTGTLTDELIAAGAEVVALEFDHELAAGLIEKYKDHETSQIFVQEGDIRDYDLSNLPENYKIVANIPYYLTANLLRKLTDTNHKPVKAALLVQKEVAQRVTAQPGSMSLLAVLIQLHYEVSTGEVVPAHVFTPPPKVDSQVLILTKRARPLFADVDAKQFLRIVKAGFSERRKKLKSSLSGGLRISKVEVEDYVRQAGVNPDSRAQELSLEQWHALYQAIPTS